MQRLISLLQTVGLTATGRLLGYARDVALAAAFGTSAIAELFIYGFRLQLFIRTLIADQPIPSLLVPLLARAPDANARRTLNRRAFAYAGGLGLLVTALLIVAQPAIIALMAPGLVADAELANPWVLASVVGIGASLSLLFTLTASVGIAILQATERFRAAALVPIAYNGVLIVTLAVAVLLPTTGLLLALWFGLGLAAAGLIQTLVAKRLLRDDAPTLLSRKLKVRPIVPKMTRNFSSVAALKLFEPLPLIVVSSFASLNAGFFAGLYFAERLTMLGPSILGLVAGAVLLTSLSRRIAAGETAQAQREFWRAVAVVFGLAVLGAAVLALLKQPIVALLFARGAFDANSTELVAAFLGPLIWLIPFAAIEYVTLQVFVTTERTRLALIIGAVSVVATLLLSFFADSAVAFAWAYAAPSIARGALSIVLASRALSDLRKTV